MAQMIEVIIAMVVTAMMASTLTTLALSPIKTQSQKSLFAASEAVAISIRKCIIVQRLKFVTDADISAGGSLTNCPGLGLALDPPASAQDPEKNQ